MKKLVITLFILFATSIYVNNVYAKSNQWEGVPLPKFKLFDQNNQIKTNQDFDQQWLVLYFYPKNKTPGCTVEAQNFTDDYQRYRKLNTDIVGVSYDDTTSHKDFAETYEIPFTLLADTDAKLSKALKVNRILPLPHASRQTFIVDPTGKILHHFKKVAPKTHSKEVLEKLKQLQTTQAE